ncbi:MAG: hypothetical protein E7399_09880 [Ruminococcaceae bacterium]|nr:hypothetical protein [Oscillospiraceae bacterium]
MKKIKGTEEAWETGELGEDLDFAKAVDDETQKQIEKIIGMQLISIRLPVDLIEDLKKIASYHEIGYQPLIRDVLQRFATSEIREIAHKLIDAPKSETKSREKPKTSNRKKAA